MVAIKSPHALTRDNKSALNDAVIQAAQMHARGLLEEAEKIYLAVLEVKPNDFDAKQLLGDIRFRQGRFDDAQKLLRRAIAINGGVAEVHVTLGKTLVALRQDADAIKSFTKAIALKRDLLDAHLERCDCLMRLDRKAEAKVGYKDALLVKPNLVRDLRTQGDALSHNGQFEAAIAVYNRVLQIQPDLIQVIEMRGIAFERLGQFEDAIASYDDALSLNPELASALYNKGYICQVSGRLEEAVHAYSRALDIKPDFVEALCNRGDAYRVLGKFEDALASYEQALLLRPNFVHALNARGIIHMHLGNFENSISDYDAALKIEPHLAKARYNRSLLTLMAGNLAAGLADYETRCDQSVAISSHLDIRSPVWNGQDIKGKRVLVHEEQGIGDTIQFSRYLTLLAARGAIVTFFVRQNMVRLLSAALAGIRVISVLDKETYDFQCGLMSLPFRLDTTLETIPAPVGYLQAGPPLVSQWQRVLGDSGFRVGIAWQGNPVGEVDIGRSVPLRILARLAKIHDVRLISLQKTHGLDQLADLPSDTPIETLGEDFDAGQDAFIDTAAVMASLDLVITSDTSIAHLAGALGRPVWVALKHVPDWRWMLDRNDSPWYPTMRLYRQATRGDWGAVIDMMTKDLDLLNVSVRAHQASVAMRGAKAIKASAAARWPDA